MEDDFIGKLHLNNNITYNIQNTYIEYIYKFYCNRHVNATAKLTIQNVSINMILKYGEMKIINHKVLFAFMQPLKSFNIIGRKQQSQYKAISVS